MHYARLSRSPRLRRALRALQAAQGEISTFDLSRRARICAVNSVIAELRANGAEIACRQAREDGQVRFYYTLLKSPEHPHAPSKTD
ncbi:hypothetical protein QO034_06355 [Sedimentitalea sp. JM2-8]|uniref:Helix-turn-helix domain-containing protein n=1 Tax=Sedimentitalea xiamensis TaxID=3050037 RepID=A0ABT7FCP6_9RHOB|nr:helix-turn-helix domain-containing protein [Sedimentitalea xiamensis]MDK3072725.1 hypothetical protein [Sedimentitalea xiamensis]